VGKEPSEVQLSQECHLPVSYVRNTNWETQGVQSRSLSQNLSSSSNLPALQDIPTTHTALGQTYYTMQGGLSLLLYLSAILGIAGLIVVCILLELIKPLSPSCVDSACAIGSATAFLYFHSLKTCRLLPGHLLSVLLLGRSAALSTEAPGRPSSHRSYSSQAPQQAAGVCD
jgi:hypothetical protein